MLENGLQILNELFVSKKIQLWRNVQWMNEHVYKVGNLSQLYQGTILWENDLINT